MLYFVYRTDPSESCAFFSVALKMRVVDTLGRVTPLRSAPLPSRISSAHFLRYGEESTLSSRIREVIQKKIKQNNYGGEKQYG